MRKETKTWYYERESGIRNQELGIPEPKSPPAIRYRAGRNQGFVLRGTSRAIISNSYFLIPSLVVITWYGQTCFRIQNPHTHILVDPFGPGLGAGVARMGGARIVLVSTSALLPSPKGEGIFVVSGPGEYERGNVVIRGIVPEGEVAKGGGERPTLYVLECEGIRVAHCNLSSGSSFSDNDIEALGEVDILLIPTGGGKQFLDGASAAEITRAVEPKIVIPMAYAFPGLKIKLDKPDPFLKAMGVRKNIPQPKLVIKKKDITKEEIEVVVLKPI